MIEFADSPHRRVTLTLAPEGLNLRARGPTLSFRGDWGLQGRDDVCVFGHCSHGRAEAAQRATLLLQPDPGSRPQLRVTLRAADGRVLLGPTVLQRTAPATAATSISQEHPACTRPSPSPAPAASPAAMR